MLVVASTVSLHTGLVTTAGRRLPPKFDAFDLAVLEDPYPGYAMLREAGPICRGGPAQWLVTRYAEVSALLRDQRLGQFQFPDAYRVFPEASLQASVGDGPAYVFTQRIVAGRDRPEHTPLRKLMAQAFTPKLVESLRPQVVGLVDAVLDTALERGTFDAVADLAVPLPLQVLCELLGLPTADRDQVGRQALRLTKIFSPVVTEADRLAADEAVRWLRRHVGSALEDRRAAPRDDLLTGMAAAEDAEHRSREEIVDNAVFLLFAGFETSMNLIASGCAALTRHPEVLSQLRADPSLVPTAVEEFLRHDPPTQVTGRIAQETIEIAGQSVRKGRLLLLMLGCANHDERQFNDPEQLDITRSPNPHLSFGGGIHYCLGAAFARLEGAVVFEQLARRVADLEPAAAPRRELSATLRAFTSVPIRVTAATDTGPAPTSPVGSVRRETRR